MARKLWSQLKPDTQKRKLGYYKSQGISESDVKSRYDAGTLGPQAGSRGHSKTPERPERARRSPGKYPEYIEKRAPSPGNPGTGAPPKRRKSLAEIVAELENARSNAFRRMMRLLRGYPYVNVDTIEANIWGGFTSESGAVPGMTLAEARFTARMSEDDLQALSSPQYLGNPWWYH